MESEREKSRLAQKPAGELLADYRSWREEELEALFKECLRQIAPPDPEARAKAEYRWSKVAKPLGSLGVLEEDITRIAAMTGTAQVKICKRALVLCCADNGVVEEGVTQTGQEVTAAVTANFTRGESCSCLMAGQAGTDVFPLDLGVACPLRELGSLHPLIDRKIRRGTANFTKEAAMSRREALAAVLTGIDLARVLTEQGYRLLVTGEMGIGNTTTSSAVASVLLPADPAAVTGKGAGLSDAGLARKVDAIQRGILLHRPDPHDGIDALSKVGGLDLAGMAGVFLGGAIYRVPVVIDGFISAASALCAAAIDSRVRDYMVAAHVSAEPAGELLLSRLGLQPAIRAGLCLGEGTGALAFLPLLDMALTIYDRMCTFSEMEIEEYKPL